MANIALGWSNIVALPTTTLTAGSEGLPVENLADQYGSTPWRTVTGVSETTLLIDAGTTTGWRAVSLHRSLMSASTVIRIRIGASSTGASPQYDSGNLSTVVGGQFVHVLPAAIASARYCLLNISDPLSNTISVGHAYAGPLMIPGVGFDTGSTYGRVSEEEVGTSAGGQERVTLHWMARRYMAALNNLTEAEARSIQDMEIDWLRGQNLLLVPEVGGNTSRDSLYGRASLSEIGHGAAGDVVRTARISIKERL